MKQTPLTHWETAKIGLLFSASVAFLLLIFWPDSRNFTIFGVNAMVVVILFGSTGALAGRLLSRTQKGAWWGAGITLFLLFWWLYTIASDVPLD